MNTLEQTDINECYGDNLAELFHVIQNELSGSMEYENDVVKLYILLDRGVVYYDYVENIAESDKALPHAFITLPYNPSQLLVINTVVTAYNTLVPFGENLPLLV